MPSSKPTIPKGVRNQWAVEHHDCYALPAVMDSTRAQFVLSLHAGHGSSCLQYATALKAISTVLD
ncbi:hypothetical protein NONO_c01960 [Nocardia nova SH22a]|uniref:Uncharacterized protein n=1 Tax=Nocardia nova SH22a TaxID=1415166 RepID=W5T7S2_9NOCA|nr:hypothetical protein [Nocardia nova]AHH15013.1 hypothetical protein NONO_c01960 [Nocardia nova SH22a]